MWKDKLIQLTWKSKIGFVYDRATFRQLRTFTYSREGWGITQDGKRLIMSDGSSTLYFWDPETFKEIGHLDVTDKGRPVPELNELEISAARFMRMSGKPTASRGYPRRPARCSDGST